MTTETHIRIQATPNPNAWKFILDRPVLMEGKATYSNPEEASHNELARSLFVIDGSSKFTSFKM